jgi:hypothetical protein
VVVVVVAIDQLDMRIHSCDKIKSDEKHLKFIAFTMRIATFKKNAGNIDKQHNNTTQHYNTT